VQLLVVNLPSHGYKIISGQEEKELLPGRKEPLQLRIPAGSSKALVEIMRS
jgi:hypothetical protein